MNIGKITNLLWFSEPGCTLPEARIPNGKVLSSYNHQIIRTVCEDGFEMQGSPVIFCNGIVWNDTLPLCLGEYVYLDMVLFICLRNIQVIYND